MSNRTHDRNLLFGILALQMDFVSRDALIGAMNAWILEKHRPLGEILVSQGEMEEQDRRLLEPMVERHVAKHQGDPARSLAALGDGPSAIKAMSAIDDEDVKAGLSNLHPPPAAEAIPPPEAEARDDSDSAAETATFVIGEATSAGKRFRVLQLHAQGGLGEVYLARDEELGRDVALKVLKAKHARNEDLQSRFVLEAEITSNLEHPGIVPVYGQGSYPDGRPFYVMRFIQGDTLETAIEDFHKEAAKFSPSKRSLHMRELLGWFVDVCEAIAYAHSRAVLHRDIKPENIILGSYGQTLILDWGLAKATGERDPATSEETFEGTLVPPSHDSHDPTLAGSRLGTLRYMSPEQMVGRIDKVDHRSDVYGLGATLYELLTGRPSVDGTPEDIRQKVLRGDIVPPRVAQPGISKPLEAICLKALKLNPEKRYQSARALAEEINRWLADEPVLAYREPFVPRTAHWVRRHKTAVAAAAVLLVTGMIGLAWDDIRVSRQEAQTETARKAADENFTVAREAVRNILFNIGRAQLPGVPQVEELRLGLVDDALNYTNRLVGHRPSDPDVRFDAAQIYREVGNIARMIGKFDKAGHAYKEGIALLKGLVGEFPKNGPYQDELALMHIDAGELARMNGLAPEAIAHFRDAISIASRLPARTSPYRNMNPLRTLGLAWADLASLQFDMGQFDEALKSSEESLRHFGTLRDAHALELQDGRLLAMLFFTQGEIYARTDEAKSIKSFGTCINICAEAIAKDPALATRNAPSFAALQADFRYFRCQGLLGRGCIVARDKDKIAEGEKSITFAIDELVRLKDEFPRIRIYQSSLALAFVRRGEVRTKRGEKARAKEDYSKATDIIDGLIAEYARNSPFRADCGRTLGDIGRGLLDIGLVAEARPILERAISEQTRDSQAESDHPLRRESLRQDREALNKAQ